jgi:hypothetical protein
VILKEALEIATGPRRIEDEFARLDPKWFIQLGWQMVSARRTCSRTI